MRDYKVCGECRWLTKEKRTAAHYECTQPQKQERWDELEKTRKNLGAGFERVSARYKYRSDMACKKFEPIPIETDCLWK